MPSATPWYSSRVNTRHQSADRMSPVASPRMTSVDDCDPEFPPAEASSGMYKLTRLGNEHLSERQDAEKLLLGAHREHDVDRLCFAGTAPNLVDRVLDQQIR